MVRSTVDPSMFYSRSGDVRLIVFVDDCCWRGEPRAAKRLAALFKAKWDADSDDCKYFLNMRIKRGDNGYPSVSQPHYAEQIAKNFGLDNSTRTAPSTPLPPGTSINKTERATTTGEPGKQKRRATKPTEVEIRQAEAMNFARPHDRDAYLRSFDITSEESDALVGKNLTRFKEAWGQLSYLSNATRPDLSHTVSMLGQISAGPRMQHWRLAQQAIRYTYATRTYGIQFGPTGPDDMPNKIECFVDASYADGPGARSQTGYVFMMNSGPLSWASRLQHSAAGSTMQAETAAAVDAAKENEFLRDLCFEFGTRQNAALPMHAHEDKVPPALWKVGDLKPIVYHEDNAACVAYHHQVNVTRRNRHMGRPVGFAITNPEHVRYAPRHARVNYHMLREAIADGEAEMRMVHTDNQLGDLFTKALGATKTVSFRNRMLTHIPVYNGESAPQGRHTTAR